LVASANTRIRFEVVFLDRFRDARFAKIDDGHAMRGKQRTQLAQLPLAPRREE